MRAARAASVRASAGLPVLAALLLSGCAPSGAGTAAAVPAPTAASVPADPAMVMVTLSDRGYRPSDIATGVQRPIMLMVVNRGARAHELRASIPLAGLQTEDPAAATPPASGGTSGFDVTLGPGQEIDVSFTPTATGRYGLSDGAATVSALVVG